MGRDDIASWEEAETVKRCLELEVSWEFHHKQNQQLQPQKQVQETTRPMHIPSWTYLAAGIDENATNASGVSLDETVQRNHDAEDGPTNSEAITAMKLRFRVNELKDAEITLSKEVNPLLKMIWKEKERKN